MNTATITVDIDKLNDAFSAAPKQVLELMYTRIPVPDSLKSYVPERDDGKMSVVGLLNQSLFVDKTLIGTFRNLDAGSDDSDSFTGFDLLDKAHGFGTDTGGRSDPGPKRSTVPVHYVTVDLFNMLWEAAQYAPDDLANRIRDASNACSELSPLNNSAPTSSADQQQPKQQKP
jgi:hypothetical protein